jgi:hypothetical protein
MDNTITGSVNVTRQDGTIYSLKTFVLRKMKIITETANRSKYYIYQQYDWLWSGHMIIKEMFHIPMKLKSELAHASMTTSDVNNQWRVDIFQLYCDYQIYLRIECILLKFHWGMKALIELHFQHEARTSVNVFICTCISRNLSFQAKCPYCFFNRKGFKWPSKKC